MDIVLLRLAQLVIAREHRKEIVSVRVLDDHELDLRVRLEHKLSILIFFGLFVPDCRRQHARIPKQPGHIVDRLLIFLFSQSNQRIF